MFMISLIDWSVFYENDFYYSICNFTDPDTKQTNKSLSEEVIITCLGLK